MLEVSSSTESLPHVREVFPERDGKWESVNENQSFATLAVLSALIANFAVALFRSIKAKDVRDRPIALVWAHGIGAMFCTTFAMYAALVFALLRYYGHSCLAHRRRHEWNQARLCWKVVLITRIAFWSFLIALVIIVADLVVLALLFLPMPTDRLGWAACAALVGIAVLIFSCTTVYIVSKTLALHIQDPSMHAVRLKVHDHAVVAAKGRAEALWSDRQAKDAVRSERRLARQAAEEAAAAARLLDPVEAEPQVEEEAPPPEAPLIFDFPGLDAIAQHTESVPAVPSKGRFASVFGKLRGRRSSPDPRRVVEPRRMVPTWTPLVESPDWCAAHLDISALNEPTDDEYDYYGDGTSSWRGSEAENSNVMAAMEVYN